MSAVAKPQLRGLLASYNKKHISIAIALSILSGAAYKFLITDPTQKRYAEFYKNYDAEKEFERMRKLGVFQSC